VLYSCGVLRESTSLAGRTSTVRRLLAIIHSQPLHSQLTVLLLYVRRVAENICSELSEAHLLFESRRASKSSQFDNNTFSMFRIMFALLMSY